MAALPSAFDLCPRSGALQKKSDFLGKIIINPGYQCDDRHTWTISRRQIVGKCDDRHCLTRNQAPNMEDQEPLAVNRQEVLIAQGRLVGKSSLLNKPSRRDQSRKSVQGLLIEARAWI